MRLRGLFAREKGIRQRTHAQRVGVRHATERVSSSTPLGTPHLFGASTHSDASVMVPTNVVFTYRLS